MNIFIIIIVIAAVIGIVVLSGQAKPKRKTQERFLKELSDLMEGTLEPITEQPNSFRVRFAFQGENFVYEEIESIGFKDKVLKSYLKLKSLTNLTLTFTEKEHVKPSKSSGLDARLREDALKAQNLTVRLPKELKNFGVYTNNPILANKLLDDPKIAGLFLEFKNIDSRGYAFVTLKIIDGYINLEFHPTGTFNPKPLFLHDNIKNIEPYLKKMLVVQRKLNEKV